MYYIIETETLDGWENVSTITDAAGVTTPMIFTTREEAQAEMDDHAASCAAAGMDCSPQRVTAVGLTPNSNVHLGNMPQALSDAMVAAGFSIWDTGGGCTAWGRKTLLDGYILVTDDVDGLTASLEHGTMGVGAYDSEGESLVEIQSTDATPEAVAGIDGELAAQYLYDRGGACLRWQVPDSMGDVFSNAHDAGAIGMDWESDCYVHPDAVPANDAERDGAASFTIPHQFQR